MSVDSTHAHHDGLPLAEIRDFLAREIKSGNQVALGLHADPNYREFLAKQLVQAQKDLEDYDKGTALGMLMRQLGFQEFDVSEVVPYNSETYRSFFGTHEEFVERYPNHPDLYKDSDERE